jgi:hypothetical protein
MGGAPPGPFEVPGGVPDGARGWEPTPPDDRDRRGLGGPAV